MREKLAALEGKRAVFRGVFQRFGSRPAFKGPPKITVLLVNVQDGSGREMCDHVWFTQGEQMRRLMLEAGDVLEFSATVKRYQKGYRGRREDVDVDPAKVDFGLSWPAKVRVVTRREAVEEGQGELKL